MLRCFRATVTLTVARFLSWSIGGSAGWSIGRGGDAQYCDGGSAVILLRIFGDYWKISQYQLCRQLSGGCHLKAGCGGGDEHFDRGGRASALRARNLFAQVIDRHRWD